MLRRRLFGVPLAMAVLMGLGIGAVLAAYVIITVPGEVTVEEAITVSPTSFTATIYPGESHAEALNLSNASSVSLDVSFTASIDPATSGVSVSIPNKVTVSGGGSAVANITISASKSAPPGIYVISIDLER